MIGLEVGFMNYGSSDRREPFSTTIPDVFVRVSTTNNFILGHAILRLQPNAGVFRPYIQGMVGFNYLFTDTKIENENNAGQEVASSTNLSDGAFSYGGGAGLMFLVYRPNDGTVSDIFVDLGARYVFGGEAEYLKEGSIRNVEWPGHLRCLEVQDRPPGVRGRRVCAILRYPCTTTGPSRGLFFVHFRPSPRELSRT